MKINYESILKSISIFFMIIISTLLLMSLYTFFTPICLENDEKLHPVVTALINPTVIKVGQIWESTANKGNPFRQNYPLQYQVLAVKDGYVKYCFVGQDSYGEWATYSASAHYFSIGVRLIKDVDNE